MVHSEAKSSRQSKKDNKGMNTRGITPRNEARKIDRVEKDKKQSKLRAQSHKSNNTSLGALFILSRFTRKFVFFSECVFWLGLLYKNNLYLTYPFTRRLSLLSSNHINT